MLLEIRAMKELPREDWLRIYAEDNRLRDLPEHEALAELAEYFQMPAACCLLWKADGICRSAARLEPWEDGFLLSCLTTAPQDRGRGYAADLLRALTERHIPLYSHIGHRNRASVRVHEKCGFRMLRDTARLLDGTVSAHIGTYRYP